MGKKELRASMTQGNLWTGILLFALPLAATGILQQFFNAADIAIVGKYTGEQGELAMAAVGANSPLVGIVTNLFVGIALGTNVVIANSIGRGDGKSINRAVHTSILIALFGGLIFSLIAQAYAVPILSSQNVPEEVLPYAVLYFRIYMLGLPVILLYNFEAAILRGMGNTTTPLLTLFLSGALNVLLNLFFVLRLKRTVDGVAIATVASNGVSALVLLIYLMKKDTPARVRLSDLRIDTPTLGKIMKIGIPAGGGRRHRVPARSAGKTHRRTHFQNRGNGTGGSARDAAGSPHIRSVPSYKPDTPDCDHWSGRSLPSGG